MAVLIWIAIYILELHMQVWLVIELIQLHWADQELGTATSHKKGDQVAALIQLCIVASQSYDLSCTCTCHLQKFSIIMIMIRMCVHMHMQQSHQNNHKKCKYNAEITKLFS